MKKFIRLADLKLQKNEMQRISGGSGSGYCNQGPPQPLLRYAVVPLYGIIEPVPLPQPEYGITAP